MTDSDEALIAAVAAGDREAFGALYGRRRPDVYRFALHMTGAPATAEDVVQDVFTTGIHEAARYTPGRSGVVAWLLGIARNHARRRLAARRPRAAAGGGRRAGGDRGPGRLHRAGPAGRGAAAGAWELPVAYREAIVLCDSQERLSRTPGGSRMRIGPVRLRLHRGRQILATKMRGERRAFAGWPAPGWM